ncbi:MAG: enoyl-CoA hydratase/isomerase family protein [Thermoleophilia bacterium]|nr:enoyl-CoA hydratase/isomerase family protein [Thermoleophilia bacterium]
MAAGPHIGYETRGPVALVTLRRPEKANALTAQMAADLHEACARLDDDDDVRVVILAAEGKAFCAGSDITTLDDYPTPWAFRNRLDYCDAILGLRKPAIAAVNGAAFGGGLELAISCDVVVASTAARFAAPEVKLGWIGGGGASQLLPRICGLANAALLLLTGDPIDAHEALRLGIVQRVVGPGELLPAALELAESIAVNAPIATQAAKAAARASLSLGLDAGMRYEEELVAVCMGTEDRNEGIAAFREKRPPRFRGR